MRTLTLLMISLVIGIQTYSQNPSYPSGKFSGIIFGDYYYSFERDSNYAQFQNSAINGAEGIHGLQIRRINLAYDYRLNEKFSSRVRLESDEANFTVNSSNKSNKFGMFVKDAFIKWNYCGGHDLLIGIQGPPAFEVSESFWGNRFLEKTIMDLRGIVPSRDLGISLKGNLTSGGTLKYWLMYANNSASKPESDIFKRYYAHLQFSPVAKLSFTAYTDYQTRADIVNTYDTTQMLDNNRLTAAIFAGYKVKDKYTLGAEAYLNQTQHGYDDTTALVTRSGYGISIFGAYTVSPRFEFVARFDHFEPNRHTMSSGDSRNWILAGLKYMPADNVIFSPNVIVETYEKSGNTEFKSSITPRLTFSFTF